MSTLDGRAVERWTFLHAQMTSLHAALLIVGHGSTVNPDSSTPSLAHASEIRRREIFSRTSRALFGKRNRACATRSFFFDDPAIREVYVVPNFISEGYFTRNRHSARTGIDRANYDTRKRSGLEILRAGRESSADDRVAFATRRARLRRTIPENETTLLIVAHGTDLNDNSAVAAKREAEKIRAAQSLRGGAECLYGRTAARFRLGAA